MKTIEPTISQLRMLSSIRGQLWQAGPEHIMSYALAALEVPERAGLEMDITDFYDLRQAAMVDQDRVGHIQIKGALMNESPGIYEKLGFVTRYETIRREIGEVVAGGAQAIIFHVNSPGGTVAGNVEACEALLDAGVPTAAHCSGLACSAAYKISACCGMIVATKSAEVGNIGTILSWQDCSEFWKSAGVEFKALVSEGADLKSTFHLEPDEAQLEFLQNRINEAGAEFREMVTTGREAAGADLSEEVWRAGWYSGNNAWALGLIDGVGSAEELRQELLGRIDTAT